MFGTLRKKLRESVEKLAKRTETPLEEIPEKQPPEPQPKQEKPQEPIPEAPKPPEPIKVKKPEPEQKPQEPQEPATGEIPVQKPEPVKPEEPVQKGVFKRLRERVTTRQLSESDIEEFFSELEMELMQSNVAVEVVEFLKKSLKEKIAGKQIRRGEAEGFISRAFEDSLFEAVNQGSVDIEGMMKEKKPLKCVILGFNGSGKTTSIAKLADYLKQKGYKPVLAAGDTFRAASIEQLEVHANRLGLKMVKQQYGSDSAAVIFDAVKHAETSGADIVLADTAGRMHTDKNLMDELKKVIRVNSPDLKILVIDSLTGNDAIEQARNFDEAVGVDAVVMTKVDVNEKGGSILSVCYAIKKPILFLGTGQEYKDLKLFNPKEFVRNLLE